MCVTPEETRLQIVHEIKQNEKPICVENTKAPTTATTAAATKLNWPKGLTFSTSYHFSLSPENKKSAHFEGEVSGKHC